MMLRDHSAIGVRIGRRWVSAAQLVRTQSGLKLTAAVEFERADTQHPFDAQDAQRLAAVLRRSGFVGQRVVLAAPSDDLVTLLMDQPRDRPLDRQVIQNELEQSHSLPHETTAMACWVVESAEMAGQETRRKVPVVAQACPHEAVMHAMSCFDGTGLFVEAIDTESWALSRLSDTPGLMAWLKVDAPGAELMVSLDGKVFYQRALTETSLEPVYEALNRQGVDAAGQAVMLDRLGLGPGAPRVLREALSGYVETVAGGVRSVLGYVSRRLAQSEVAGLTVVGDLTAVPGLAEALHVELDMPAASLKAIEGWRTPGDEGSCRMAFAMGLALHDKKEAA